MTCIVGLVEEGQVWLASDSCIADDTHTLTSAESKLAHYGSWVYGVAGDVRCLNLLRHGMVLPEPPNTGLDAFVATDVAKAFSEALAGLEGHTFEALLGCRGQLYYIGGDYATVRLAEPYAAIGEGGPVALGVLSMTHSRRAAPKTKLTQALEQSARYTLAVSAPWHFYPEG
jgi:hypothetical protein